MTNHINDKMTNGDGSKNTKLSKEQDVFLCPQNYIALAEQAIEHTSLK